MMVDAATIEGQPGGAIVQMQGIYRRFGHVEAVSNADLELLPGEILGLVGDNGAGKSTLMKILGGVVEPDSGEITIAGSTVRIESAQKARTLGIEMIHQDLALFNNLDVATNIFIGRERTARFLGVLPYIDRRTMRHETSRLLQRLGNAVRADANVGGLSGGQRQMVAVARAVAFASAAQIVIMDEPSAALGVTEAATVLELIRGLRSQGHSVIMISHRIPEVLSVSDRVMVMKAGRGVALLDAATTTVDECVGLIVSGTVDKNGSSALAERVSPDARSPESTGQLAGG